MSEEVAAATTPFYTFCMREFGVERCMFASNFPPDKASCSYTTLWNSFKRVAASAGCSDGDTQRLLHDNAVRIYRVPDPTAAS